MQLLGVVATNALELGVDIGSLDVVLMLGHPGSASSLWQQMGRAGRGGKASLAILVTYDSPTDQFFVRYVASGGYEMTRDSSPFLCSDPPLALRKPPEASVVDPTNPHLLRLHALAAAAEAPLRPWDGRHVFGLSALGAVVSTLRGEGLLIPDADASPTDGIGLGLGQGHHTLFPAAPLSASEAAEAARLGPLRAWTTSAWVDRPASRFNLRSIDDVLYKVGGLEE